MAKTLEELEEQVRQLELALAKHCHSLPECDPENEVYDPCTEEEDRHHCEGEVPCKGYIGACSNRAVILRESGLRVCIECNDRIEKDK